jgi:hypothetical protein
VDPREAGRNDRVIGPDEQRPEAAFLNALREPRGFRKFPDALLDGDLPDSRRADIHVRLVIETDLYVVGQRRIVGEPPEHHVHVQQ